MNIEVLLGASQRCERR